MAATTRPTLRGIPLVNPELSMLETNLELVALEELGDGIFTNVRPLYQPVGARGIYGGCVIAQCLAAAQRTVDEDMKIHSMHCYFVLAGSPTTPVLYHVERVRSGRSFATRTVQARQRGQCIFTTTCSFVRTSTKSNKQAQLEHSVPLPSDVPTPEDCVTDEAQLFGWYTGGNTTASDLERLRRGVERDPVEWRWLGITDRSPDIPPTDKRSRQWARVKGKIRNEESHLPALAYFSDCFMLGMAVMVNRLQMNDIGMMVSLDHTIYFHHPSEIRSDEWMFMEVDSPWAGEGRALATLRIWNQSGGLIATCYQEGLIRLKREGGKVIPIDGTSKL